jgi:hypothetical protein
MKELELTLVRAAYRASRYLRRHVDEKEVRAWCSDGLSFATNERKQRVIARHDLDRYLVQIEADERLMTVTETSRRLLTDYGACVTERTVRAWCEHGYGVGGERAYLRYTFSPMYSPSRRLIHPADLALFVEQVGIENLGRVGRPVGSGKS